MSRVGQVVNTAVLSTLLIAGTGTAFAQWPQFRGPNGSGIDSGAAYPSTFSPSKNVVWKAAMPAGQSSPVVAGGHVYLTASDGDRLLTIGLEAATGRELWRREIKRPRTPKIYHANDPASPTPAADTDGVVGALIEAGISKRDAMAFAEGMRRGGNLVTIRVASRDRDFYQQIMAGSHIRRV